MTQIVHSLQLHQVTFYFIKITEQSISQLWINQPKSNEPSIAGLNIF